MKMPRDEFSWLDGETDDDTSWLDTSTDVAAAKRKPRKSSKKSKSPKVESTNKIDHETVRGRAMFAAVKGRKRTYACDGQYLFLRRKNLEAIVDGHTVRNDTFLRLHADRVAAGELTHVDTQDDVEVYEVNPGSPLYHEPMYFGTMNDTMVQRQCVLAACKQDWSLYLDALKELAGRVKSQWQHEAQATAAWQDRLKYVMHLIALRGGPAQPHIDAALQRVRMRRGEGQGRVILTPPRR